jgi:hypothetical protein
MTEIELTIRLMNAFEPYIRGYCSSPHRARLDVTVTARSIDGDLTLVRQDFRAIAKDIAIAADVEGAFNSLCRVNDPTRGPSLRFVDGG